MTAAFRTGCPPVPIYCYGGLSIRSDAALDQLRPAGENGAADLDLTFPTASAPVADRPCFELDGRYRLAVGRLGERWVFRSKFDGVFVLDAAGRTLDCHIDNRVDDAWQDVLVRRVLPRIAVLRGAHAIHAAAGATDDGAALLVGRSGAGKSTLTAALGLGGWAVLSDDTAIVRVGPTPQVTPVHRGVAIWEESRIGLGLPKRVCRTLPGYDGRKVQFSPPNDRDPTSRPLTAIVLLDRIGGASAPALIPITPADAIHAVARQTVPFDPTAAPDARSATAFASLAVAVRRTPTYRLHYPDDFTALPEVDAVLQSLLRDIGRSR